MTSKEAIKILKSKLDGNTDTSYEWCEAVRLAINALEDRPQGEWITKNEYTHDCNLCGCSMLDTWDFCPNCGADMRVKDELNHALNELGGNNESLL